MVRSVRGRRCRRDSVRLVLSSACFLLSTPPTVSHQAFETVDSSETPESAERRNGGRSAQRASRQRLTRSCRNDDLCADVRGGRGLKLCLTLGQNLSCHRRCP